MAKNKTIKKIIIILSLTLIMISCYPIFTQALLDPTVDPNSWEPSIQDDADFNEKVSNVLGIINTIGIVVSIIVLMLLGVKYILGSVEEKAEYKKAIVPYIVGMVLLVSVTTLPNIIYKIVTSSGFFG